MADIFCTNIHHKQQQIVLYCLNKQCTKKQKACKDCVSDFHEGHIEDCFTLSEMLFILDDHIIKLNKLDIQLFIDFENELKSIISNVEEEKENLLNFNQRGATLNNIIQTAFQCHNNHFYMRLVSLIFSQAIKQKDFKENYFQNCLKNLKNAFAIQTLEYKQKRFEQLGHRLFELKRYSECINYYNCADQLGNQSEQLIQNHIIALNASLQYDKALIQFKKNINRLTLTDQEWLWQVIKFQQNPTVYQDDRLLIEEHKSIDFLVNWGLFLINTHQFDQGLQIINQVLNTDPCNRFAIEAKVVVLVKQGKLGEAKEYIDLKLNDYPKEQQAAKGICLTLNQKYFAHWNTSAETTTENYFNCQNFKNFINELCQDNPNIQQLDNYLQLPNDPEFEYVGKAIRIIIENFKNSQQKGVRRIPKLFQVIYYFSNKQYNEALEIIEELQEIQPSRIFHLLKSQILMSNNQFKEGLEEAKIAMYFGKRNDFCTRIYAIALTMNRQFQNALKVLEKSQSKDHYKFHNLKGILLYLMNNFLEAKKCFSKALSQNKNNETSKYFLQIIRNKIGEDGEINDQDQKTKKNDTQLQILNNDQMIEVPFNIILKNEFDMGEILQLLDPISFMILISI